MATFLPLIRANVPPEIKQKMEFLASENDRSLSKEITQACRAWIKKYEAENGEIQLWALGMMAKFGKYNLKTISLRLEENTLERIDAQTSEYENRTDYIRKAILEQLKKDEFQNA